MNQLSPIALEKKDFNYTKPIWDIFYIQIFCVLRQEIYIEDEDEYNGQKKNCT